MARLARLGAPVVWLLGASTNAVLGFLGLAATPSARVTEDEIRALLAEGAAAGMVKPVEHEMIEGVMQIADRPVRAIMTPRTEITWLDVTASTESIRTALVDGAHARYPVCRGLSTKQSVWCICASWSEACLPAHPLDLPPWQSRRDGARE